MKGKDLNKIYSNDQVDAEWRKICVCTVGEWKPMTEVVAYSAHNF